MELFCLRRVEIPLVLSTFLIGLFYLFPVTLTHAYYLDDWINLGGSVKQVEVGNDGQGRLSVFGIGSADNSTYCKFQLSPGGNWSEWTSLGGSVKQIAVGNDGQGQLSVFGVGSADNSTYYKYQSSPGINGSSGNWSDWHNLGGLTSSIETDTYKFHQQKLRKACLE